MTIVTERNHSPIALRERLRRPPPAVALDEPDPRASYRGDVEGLRALAVVLVLLYHADSRLVPGGFVGVDVFFVISGFLITSLLLAEVEETGTISISRFYSRRARRLLPAVAVVLAAVAALTVALLPRIRWVDVGYDIVASATYVANWRFAEGAVDYLAQHGSPSPVQHFWSLAVEEQFYLLWPVLLLGAAWLARRGGRVRPASRRWLLVGWAIVFVPSLAWSVVLTGADAGRAYFVTTTRMWELALGGLVAIMAVSLARLPRPAAAALAWGGLGAVVAAGLMITTATPFPGWVALVPTLGTAAIIAAGPSAGSAGPVRLLGLRPVRATGALSYSLYLWHWPLLVLVASRWGPLSTGQSLAVVAFTALPAYATYRWVENPFRRARLVTARPGEVLRYGGLVSAGAAVAGLAVVLAAWPPPPPLDRAAYAGSAVGAAAAGTGAPLGARALPDDPRDDPAGTAVDQVDSITPTAAQAADDVPVLYDRGCPVAESETEVVVCEFGAVDSSYEVALVGDSFAAQWTSPLIQIAVERDWRVEVYVKSSCPLADVTVRSSTGAPNDNCTTWNEQVVAMLTGDDRPDVVVASSGGSYLDSTVDLAAGNERFGAGLARTWTALADAGVEVVALLDTPKPGLDVAECVSRYERELTRCAVARSVAVGTRTTAQRRAAAAVPGVSVVDLTDAICPGDPCAAVIGGALVYRDAGHLTDTYARSLTPRLDAALARVLG